MRDIASLTRLLPRPAAHLPPSHPKGVSSSTIFGFSTGEFSHFLPGLLHCLVSHGHGRPLLRASPTHYLPTNECTCPPSWHVEWHEGSLRRVWRLVLCVLLPLPTTSFIPSAWLGCFGHRCSTKFRPLGTLLAGPGNSGIYCNQVSLLLPTPSPSFHGIFLPRVLQESYRVSYELKYFFSLHQGLQVLSIPQY